MSQDLRLWACAWGFHHLDVADSFWLAEVLRVDRQITVSLMVRLPDQHLPKHGHSQGGMHECKHPGWMLEVAPTSALMGAGRASQHFHPVQRTQLSPPVNLPSLAPTYSPGERGPAGPAPTLTAAPRCSHQPSHEVLTPWIQEAVQNLHG